MNKFKKTGRKALSVFLSATTTLWLVGGVAVMPIAASAASLTSSQVSAIISLLQSFGADSSTIANVQASLTGGTPTGGSTGTATDCVFNRSLTLGSTGEDVKCLQKFLNGHGYPVASTGPGSPGSESTYFGAKTKAAVAAWQSAAGITPAVGYFGPISQAAIAAMGGTPPTTPPGTPTPPPGVGTGLTVSAATQPQAALAPLGAARVPFTKATFTASSDGDVVVTGLVVERTGPSSDTAFAGIVLLDENGTQLGIAKTLNSNHQATLTESFTVKAGMSRTMTIAGNMTSTAGSIGAGNVAFLALNTVNTSATVNGVLPIVGAGQTMNSSLTIGTISTVARGALDPGSSQTKEVGTTAYNFASVKLTSGSGEDLSVRSIRWNQTGSAGSGDLANVNTIVAGTSYPATVSTDGKYYTTVFPGTGLELPKGFSIDITIAGDIAGGSNRTIDFDIAKRTDINIVGKLFGYGITPAFASSDPTDDSGNFSSVEDPYYDATQVTVSAGTLSASTDSSVAAQNVAINLLNQTIAGFTIDVKGEPISVGSMPVRFALGEDSGTALVFTADLTNIVLVDSTGKVLAGPVDGSSSSNTVTFTDSVTFQPGVTKVMLKAKLGTDFATNDTVAASTTPSGWTSVTGQNTGNSITPTPSSAITGPTQTVKAGALTVSVSSLPAAQTVISGAIQYEFSRYVVDAGQSGEDVRITNLPLELTFATAVANEVTNCQLYDGATSVTSSNLVNPSASAASADDHTFNFNNSGLLVTKGTSKTLSLKCDVSKNTSANDSFSWGIENGIAYTAASGVDSGQTIVENFVDSNGQTMTVAAAGSYTVTSDSSILYKLAKAGATDQTIGAFRFEAGTSEDILLKQIALQLGNLASSSPADFLEQKVTLWADGANIGTAQFGTSQADYATSTTLTVGGTQGLRITKGESKLVTVKASLSTISAVTGTPGAFIAVNYDGDNNGLNGNYATGADSGTTISGTSGDVTTNGLRIARNIPAVAVPAASNGGALSAGGNLYTFTVTNSDSRDLILQKFTFSVATSGFTAASSIADFTLYADEVAFNTSAVNYSHIAAGGNIVEVPASGTSNAQIVPANSAKTFILKAASAPDIASVGESVSLALLADTSYPTCADVSGTDNLLAFDVTCVEGNSGAQDNMIWSPFSTTTPVATAATQNNADWYNGYGVPGFPSNQNFPVYTWSRAN